jgi:lipopolysaccharide transport protein LptA
MSYALQLIVLKLMKKNMVSSFVGNVVFTKGEDKITTQKMVVKFDKNKKPLSYEAIGKSDIKITLPNKKTFLGSAKSIKFDVENNIMTLQDNVKINQSDNTNTILGEKVKIDKSSGKINIQGKANKPVEFIFKINEDKNETNKL